MQYNLSHPTRYPVCFSVLLTSMSLNAQIKITNTLLIDTKINSLYVGVENLLKIDNNNTATYSLTAARATVEARKELFVVKPNSPGQDTLRIIKDGQIVDSHIFNVVYLPLPAARAGTITTPKTSSQPLADAGELRLVADNFNLQGRFMILSFRVTIKSTRPGIQETIIKNESSSFSDNLTRALRQAEPGDQVSFENIVVKGSAENSFILRPLTITIE